MRSPFLFDFANDFDGEDEFYCLADWYPMLQINKLLTTVCSTSKLLSQAFRGNISEDCNRVNTQVSKELTLSIDKNNVLGDICVPMNQSQLEKLNLKISSRFQLHASLPQQVKSKYIYTNCHDTCIMCWDQLNAVLSSVYFTNLAFWIHCMFTDCYCKHRSLPTTKNGGMFK